MKISMENILIKANKIAKRNKCDPQGSNAAKAGVHE